MNIRCQRQSYEVIKEKKERHTKQGNKSRQPEYDRGGMQWRSKCSEWSAGNESCITERLSTWLMAERGLDTALFCDKMQKRTGRRILSGGEPMVFLNHPIKHVPGRINAQTRAVAHNNVQCAYAGLKEARWIIVRGRLLCPQEKKVQTLVCTDGRL